MSFEAERDAPIGPLVAEDARALTRLLRRALGRGFRLVVIEVATPRLRKRVVEWLRARVEPLAGRVLELDVGSLPGENLWSELGERHWSELGERHWSELGERLDHGAAEREPVVLALHGFQEAAHGQPDERAGIYRQLNVQRDLFVRDLGCFWVLLIDPYGSRKLQDIAPDFCDFASLWIRAPEVETSGDAMPRMTHDVARSVAVDVDEAQSELLHRAGEAIAAGRFAEARDLLTRFELVNDEDNEEHGLALRLRGLLELRRGNLHAARHAGERALAWGLARGDRGQSEVAEALHLLGSVLAAQGHYEQARSSLERSLEIKRELHGTLDHPSIAFSLHELAGAHRALGNVEEARRLLERALELHVNPAAVASSLHDLASISLGQGDYDGARRMLERTLEIESQAFATDLHPNVATTLRSLASVLRQQRDLGAARQHVERALEIEAEVLGTEVHPNIAASLHQLGMILREQGDLDGARQKLERALEIETEVLGTQTHPNVAAALHELAGILREQGDLDGARRQYQRALEISVEVFGTELHPQVATILHSLAMLLEDQGELDEAAAAYERALNIDTRVEGPDHHSTCMTEVAFAQLLLDMGERARAETLLRHARPILVGVLGPGHPWVQKADALLDAVSRRP